MIINRLGVLTDEISQDLTVALDWAKRNGLTHVEIRMIDRKNIADFSDREIEKVLNEVEKRDLYISCVASPVFKCALDPTRMVATGDTFGQGEESVDDHFGKLARMIDICKKLNTDKIRIFSFWREKNPEIYVDEIVDHLKKAAEIAGEHDILLLLENEGSCNGGYASEVAELVRKVDSPYLKVLWDPGNEAYQGSPAFPEGYEAVKDLIGHIHLKDATKGVCVPIGEGDVLFKKQFQALEKDGYEGLFTIETHYFPEGGTALDGTDMTLEGLKNILR